MSEKRVILHLTERSPGWWQWRMADEETGRNEGSESARQQSVEEAETRARRSADVLGWKVVGKKVICLEQAAAQAGIQEGV